MSIGAQAHDADMQDTRTHEHIRMRSDLEAEAAVLLVIEHPERKDLGIDDRHHCQHEVQRRSQAVGTCYCDERQLNCIGKSAHKISRCRMSAHDAFLACTAGSTNANVPLFSATNDIT